MASDSADRGGGGRCLPPSLGLRACFPWGLGWQRPQRWPERKRLPESPKVRHYSPGMAPTDGFPRTRLTSLARERQTRAPSRWPAKVPSLRSAPFWLFFCSIKNNISPLTFCLLSVMCPCVCVFARMYEFCVRGHEHAQVRACVCARACSAHRGGDATAFLIFFAFSIFAIFSNFFSFFCAPFFLCFFCQHFFIFC